LGGRGSCLSFSLSLSLSLSLSVSSLIFYIVLGEGGSLYFPLNDIHNQCMLRVKIHNSIAMIFPIQGVERSCASKKYFLIFILCKK
jgi:hypothetical protein